MAGATITSCGRSSMHSSAPTRVNQPGKLFTIIGRQTFSAAMNCVNRMKLNTDTLFVGEPTGSSPNMYGDNAPVVLPQQQIDGAAFDTLVAGYGSPRPTGVASA